MEGGQNTDKAKAVILTKKKKKEKNTNKKLVGILMF